MLIGIDCGCLGIENLKNRGGIYSVTKTLIKFLGKIDKKNKYLLYSFYPIDKKIMGEFGKSAKNVVVTPTKGWMDLWIPFKLNKDRPDIFIGMSQAMPRKLPFLYHPKIIVFMYDLGFEKFPKLYKDFPSRLKKNSRYASLNSDLIITTSNASKKDIINLYKISSSKIKVVYPSLDNYKKDFGKFKNTNPYFLFVGAFKPTKNITNIVKAFLLFSKLSKVKFNLILTGGSSQEITQLAKENPKLGIKIMGFVSDEKLAKLYRNTTAFVSPSFYEGFGMTFLEAMKFAVPIIASDKGSIPEVVGNAAIFVNPNDEKKLAKEMIKLSVDKKLHKKMSSLALKRSKQFPSSNFGRKVLDIINSL